MTRNPKENTGLLPVSLSYTGEKGFKRKPQQQPDHQGLQSIQDNQALLITVTWSHSSPLNTRPMAKCTACLEIESGRGSQPHSMLSQLSASTWNLHKHKQHTAK